MERFRDRSDAGRRLARVLMELKNSDPLILALPRGGVPVAYEVAVALCAPLDILIVRKLGVPFQPELAMGAIGEDEVLVVDERVVADARITAPEFWAVEYTERQELELRVRRFRGGRPPLSLERRTVIIVDDGIATGSTARAACQLARARGAQRVILAVPVASATTLEQLRPEVDELVCLKSPRWAGSVGQSYDEFSQVSDEQVVALLSHAAQHEALPTTAARSPSVDCRDDEVTIEVDGIPLSGHLTVPEASKAFVLFAHGSGSSRHSPRNRFVATTLNGRGLATLLFDLLSHDEEAERSNVFDIDLLAQRLLAATHWLRGEAEAEGARFGYFGASTGAAAALVAAAAPAAGIDAIVSRGGRPDLAGSRLAAVRAPTLLLVGGHDPVVLELSRRAQAALTCENRLAIVPGATHLFEEPGALEAVAAQAGDWFTRYLAPLVEARS